MILDMEGQTAIVTGAARGIGLAIAHRLNALGVQVIGWDRDIEPIADDKIFLAVEAVDVTDEIGITSAFANAATRAGDIHILINNAGINGRPAKAWEYTLAEWNQVLAIDLTGVFLGCRATVPHMIERGYGRIVTIASIAGKEGAPNACAYGAAKSGVIGYTKGLARELVGTGVLANCVAPVITETDLLKEMTPEYIEAARSRIPMGRLATPEDIADTAAFAASPRCGFTTGFTFDVSGGRATY